MVSKMVLILLNMMLVVWMVASSPMPLLMTKILLTVKVVASQLMMILITTRMIKLPVQERDRMKMRVIMNVVLMKMKMLLLLLMMLIVKMPHGRRIDISTPRLKMTTLAHDGKKGRKLAGGHVSLAFLTWDCGWWDGDRGGHRGVEEKENAGWF